jgi:hypothetical protein
MTLHLATFKKEMKMGIKKDLRKKHRLYLEYLNFLNWDSINYNAFEDTDDDFFEWVMSYEIDSDWKKETV